MSYHWWWGWRRRRRRRRRDGRGSRRESFSDGARRIRGRGCDRMFGLCRWSRKSLLRNSKGRGCGVIRRWAHRRWWWGESRERSRSAWGRWGPGSWSERRRRRKRRRRRDTWRAVEGERRKEKGEGKLVWLGWVRRFRKARSNKQFR